MNSEELWQIIRCGETSRVQFKESFSNQKQLAAEIIAFANSKGGMILFGIEDKTGSIRGMAYQEIQRIAREIGNTANEQVRPIVYLQTIGTSEKDLDIRFINDFIRKVYHKEPEDFGISYNQLLQNLRITDTNGSATLSGLLYFGKQPQQYKPSFMIKAVSFYGNEIAETQYRDSKDIIGTIPELFSQGMTFLKSNLHSIQAGQSFNSIGKLEISEIALEEILQNALVHREYIKTAPIRLLIFENRVEIISPGCLPDGLTIEDIKLGNSYQRNQLIATLCAKTMVYRGLGSGIIRAMHEGAHIEFINNESGNQFTTIIYRNKQEKLSQEEDVSVPSSSQASSVLSQAYPKLEALLSQVCPKLETKEIRNASQVFQACLQPRSMQELLQIASYTNRNRFRKNVFNHLQESYLVEATIKNIPNSPLQRYIVTKKGKELIERSI